MRFNYKFENKNGMESYKYERGKIYKIYSKTLDNCYYGSTIKTLNVRLSNHKSKFKTGIYCKSQDILKYDDYEIILVENFPCTSKKELEQREGYYQRNFKCINKLIASRTKKQYYNDHKEQIKLKKNKKCTCVCGKIYTHSHKARHEKSNKHIKYINNLQSTKIAESTTG